ncbi:MAG: holo-ACP synthase [Opitutales bacterium]|nr:holo-ACP synthase [Opitutales bacterium]
MQITLPPGGTVIGLGTDLIECARVAKVLERQGDRFLDRVYTPAERSYCMQMKNPTPHLAARFAAKEAVSKAFTTGIGAELGWRSIEVRKGERGEPIVHLDEKGRALLHSLGGSGVLLSLAHTAVYGHAVALLLK